MCARWLVILLVCAGGDVAHAEGERFRLVYERAPGAEACPSEQRLRDDVGRRLGREPFGAAARTTLVCRVGRHGAGLRAVITVVEAEGPGPERVLDSPRTDCADLAQAMELTLALAIDPSANLSVEVSDVADAVPEPAPADELRQWANAQPPRPATAIAAKPQESVATVAPASDVSMVLGAALVADVGVGPGPGLGAAVGARWSLADASLGFEVGASFASGANAFGGTVRTQLGSLALVPCWMSGRLALCGVARAGVLRGSGAGLEAARADVGFWAGAGARVAWRVATLGGLGWRLLGEATAPLVGERLLVGGEEAWRSPPVAAALGVEVLFP